MTLPLNGSNRFFTRLSISQGSEAVLKLICMKNGKKLETEHALTVTVSCRFGHIYCRNLLWKTSFFVQ